MILNKLEKIVQSVDINITENQLLDLLKNIKRWPYKYPWGQGSVEIINNLGTLNKELFFSSKNNFGSNYLDFEKWIYYYDLGYTTIISNILDLTKELRILEKKLSDAIGSNINANFYFSKPKICFSVFNLYFREGIKTSFLKIYKVSFLKLKKLKIPYYYN